MPDIDWIPPEAVRPTEPTICLNMGNHDDANVAFFAFRYALARATTAPYIVVPWILDNWHRFPAHDRVQMQQEIRDHLERHPDTLADCADLWRRVLERAA